MPPLLALPPVVLASIIGGGSTIGATAYAGRKSKSTKAAESQATRQSAAETQSLEQRTQLISDLIQRISATEGTAPPIFQFGEAAGGPANDPAFLEGIQPMAGINMLMQLAGMGTPGTGATQGILNRDTVASGQAQGFAGDIGSNITFMIAELMKKREGQGGGLGEQLINAPPAVRFDPLGSGIA